MELVHGAKAVMFPLCCEYGLLSSQPLHVAIQFSAFQIHVQFYRKKWWMYHVDPAYTIMLYCLHFIADDWGVLYKVDRHRNTHTHIPTQSINFEHSNCLFDVCHNSHAGSGLQMVWKSLRSRNCGVDHYMHGQNFLTTGWFLASSIVYIYCSFTGEFCQLVWQIGVLFVWHWCSPKLFQNLLFKL